MHPSHVLVPNFSVTLFSLETLKYDICCFIAVSAERYDPEADDEEGDEKVKVFNGRNFVKLLNDRNFENFI